jgi:hypothetical protein
MYCAGKLMEGTFFLTENSLMRSFLLSFQCFYGLVLTFMKGNIIHCVERKKYQTHLPVSNRG